MDYGYQQNLIDKCIGYLDTGPGVVLAGTPGSGKTNMALKLIRLHLMTQDGNALVLTHGQTLLREQWMGRVTKDFPGYPFPPVELTEDKNLKEGRLHIGIPHFFGKQDGGRKHRNVPKNYTIIAIDEAHQFGKDGGMVDQILKANPKAKLIFLTGTPSKFVVDGKYPIVAITALELLQMPDSVLTDPYVELAQTELDLNLSDYNAINSVKETKELAKKQTLGALDQAMKQLQWRLESKHRNPEKYKQFGDLRYVDIVTGVASKLSKTMICCRSIKQAEQVLAYFQNRGVVALLSTSENDKDSSNVTAFTAEGSTVTVLVVVDRGILGFDYPALCNIIDFTLSMTPDVLFQMLCRVIRRHGDTEKIFIKVVPTHLAVLTQAWMGVTMAMSQPEYYTNKDFYENVGNTKIPVWRAGKRQKSTKAPLNRGRRHITTTPPEYPIDILNFMGCFKALAHLNSGAMDSYAYTTVNITKNAEFGIRVYDPDSTRRWKANILEEIATMKAMGVRYIQKVGNTAPYQIRELMKSDPEFRIRVLKLAPELETRSYCNYIPVFCHQNKKEYESQTKAAKDLDLNQQDIAKALKATQVPGASKTTQPIRCKSIRKEVEKDGDIVWRRVKVDKFYTFEYTRPIQPDDTINSPKYPLEHLREAVEALEEPFDPTSTSSNAPKLLL